MRMCRKISAFIMLLAIMAAMVIPANADGITPYLNNTNMASASFDIDENGVAIVGFTCRGIRGTVTQIVVESKIEKQVGASWVEVDGASWTDESTFYLFNGENSVTLTEGGTYKATVTFTVYGTGGDADVITREIEKSY